MIAHNSSFSTQIHHETQHSFICLTSVSGMIMRKDAITVIVIMFDYCDNDITVLQTKQLICHS